MIERDYLIDMTLQCIKRKTAKTPLHVFLIFPDTLKSMLLFMDLDKSEDPRNDLTRGKFYVDSPNNIALVLVDHSKVVQFMEKQIISPMIGAENSPLNVVYYLDLLFKSNPADDDSPAFSYLKGADCWL